MNNQMQYFLSTMKPHFNLRNPKGDRPTMVYLVINIKRQYKVSLGLKVIPSQWNSKDEVAMISPMLTTLDCKNNMLINAKILEYRNKYSQLIIYLCNNIEKIDNPQSIIKDIFEMKAKSKVSLSAILNSALRNHNMAESSFKIYNYQLQIFLEWINKVHPNYSLDDCNLSLIKEYSKFLFEQKVTHPVTKEQVFEQNNTVNYRVNLIVTIFSYLDAEDKFDLDGSKMKKIKTTQKSFKQEENQVTLDEEEIQALIDVELEGKEDMVRDLFLFQLSICQRFSDVAILMGKNIKDNINDNTITLIQTKTKTEVTAPLDDTAMAVLEKYNYTLPKITTNICDKLLKTIAKKAGLNNKVNCKELRNNEWYIYQTEKYNVIATHTARRTFITNGLDLGLDSQVLKKISGHKTDSAFSRYNRLSSTSATKQYLEKKGSKTSGNAPSCSSNDIPVQLSIEDKIEDYRRVLAMFGVPAIEYMEITDIEELSRVLFTYENKICSMIKQDYRFLKELYNGDGTLKDKYFILRDIIKNA